MPKSTPAPGAVPKYAGPDAVRSPGNAEEKVNPEEQDWELSQYAIFLY